MDLSDKIFSAQKLDQLLITAPRPIVMTNGVFDILHLGHVEYLSRAAKLGASLIVAINTDRSVRELGKGSDRPINKERDRALVLAGLQSVTYVTFFDAETPVGLIKLLKPEVYVKGGDYDIELLEETRLTRSWGGDSIAIPFVTGYSTTNIINNIRKPFSKITRKAAFLDRDGVINKDDGYVHLWQDFKFIPGAISAMKTLQDLGYVIVIVTNQSGIARGIFTEGQYKKLTSSYIDELTKNGVNVDAVYHCPHHPNGIIPKFAVDCECRKPAPGMLYRAERDMNLNLSISIMIGDKTSDMMAARAAGVGLAFQIQPPSKLLATEELNVDGYYSSLQECVDDLILNEEKMLKITKGG